MVGAERALQVLCRERHCRAGLAVLAFGGEGAPQREVGLADVARKQVEVATPLE